MAAYTIFSCKGLTAKQSIALQILGYTTISIIAEKFEQEPQADIQTFRTSEQTQLNDFVESVNICGELWELVKDSAPASEIFFAKIYRLMIQVFAVLTQRRRQILPALFLISQG